MTVQNDDMFTDVLGKDLLEFKELPSPELQNRSRGAPDPNELNVT